MIATILRRELADHLTSLRFALTLLITTALMAVNGVVFSGPGHERAMERYQQQVKQAGDRLVGGTYEPIELTTSPDGLLKGYSDLMKLSLCWDNGWPRLYDPATGTYLESWPEVWDAREAAEAQAAVEQAGRLAERAARRAAENRAAVEQAARERAEAQAAVEQAARLAERAAREAAEARIRQLEAELRRRQADR